ncbi:MAG: hypothetical protein JWN12_785 [Candidatus Saccharibacteria bacterium]|nr:hypothetical protein [Candidatus Saccharibacteria bacterium]
MNKKHYSKFKIKDKVLKNELARAHGMIILLVIALMSILAISNMLETTLDPVLTFIAIALLGIVGLLSLSVVLSILTKRT